MAQINRLMYHRVSALWAFTRFGRLRASGQGSPPVRDGPIKAKVERPENIRKWQNVELNATRIFQRLRLPTNQKYFVLTVTIAIACGLVAVSYHLLIKLISANLIERAIAIQGPSRTAWILIIPTAGGLAAGLLIHFLAPDARATGIPQFKIAFSLNYGR